jgi:hypothetical protein
VNVQQYMLLPLLVATFALTVFLVLRLLGLEEEDRDVLARIINRARLRA